MCVAIMIVLCNFRINLICLQRDELSEAMKRSNQSMRYCFACVLVKQSTQHAADIVLELLLFAVWFSIANLRQTNKFIVFAGGLKTSDPENDFDLAPVPDHPRGECALRSRGGCEISHIKSHFASGSPTKCMICHCMAHNRISLRNIHCIFNTTFIRHVLQFIFGYSMFIADQGIISKTHKMLVSHR